MVDFEKRIGRVMVYLTENEYTTIVQKYQKLGVAPAVFVRHCALGTTPSPQEKIQSHTPKYNNQLAWIGNNLNQIAKVLNTLKASGTPEKISLAELNITLHEIHNELSLLANLIRQEQPNDC